MTHKSKYVRFILPNIMLTYTYTSVPVRPGAGVNTCCQVEVCYFYKGIDSIRHTLKEIQVKHYHMHRPHQSNTITSHLNVCLLLSPTMSLTFEALTQFAAICVFIYILLFYCLFSSCPVSRFPSLSQHKVEVLFSSSLSHRALHCQPVNPGA